MRGAGEERLDDELRVQIKRSWKRIEGPNRSHI